MKLLALGILLVPVLSGAPLSTVAEGLFRLANDPHTVLHSEKSTSNHASVSAGGGFEDVSLNFSVLADSDLHPGHSGSGTVVILRGRTLVQRVEFGPVSPGNEVEVVARGSGSLTDSITILSGPETGMIRFGYWLLFDLSGPQQYATVSSSLQFGSFHRAASGITEGGIATVPFTKGEMLPLLGHAEVVVVAGGSSEFTIDDDARVIVRNMELLDADGNLVTDFVYRSPSGAQWFASGILVVPEPKTT